MKRTAKTAYILIALCLMTCMLCTQNMTAYAASGLPLKKTTATIGVGETANCIKVLEKDREPTDYTYTSSNKKVATVNKKGQVKGKKAGSAEITVKRGGKKAKIKITVKKAAKKITLSETSLTLGVGESFDVDSSVKEGASYSRAYSTADKAVATVKDSIIKAVAVGQTKITVKTFNGKKATCTVTVKEAPTSISITNKNNVVQKGSNNHKIKIKLSKNAASKKITYKIADKSIATIDSKGYVTGKKKGKTKVTVTAYNGVKAEQTIQVKDNSLSLNVNSTQIALDNARVEKIIYGKSVQKRNLEGFIITPEKGYKKTLFIDFAVHGFEDSYYRDGKKLTELANALIKYFASHSDELKNYRLVIVPCANPDGTIAGKNNYRACSSAFGRCTAKHVDMNRDFGPFKGLETRKLRDFILDCDPNIYINAHGWLNETFGTKKLCNIIDKSLGLGPVNSGVYAANQGYAIGWVHNRLNIPCCLLEYKSAKSLSVSKNIKMIKEIIKQY